MLVQKLGPKGSAALEVAAKMRTWAKAQGIKMVHCLVDINGTPFPTCKDFERLAGVVAAMGPSGGQEPAELLQGGGDVTFHQEAGVRVCAQVAWVGGLLAREGY